MNINIFNPKAPKKSTNLSINSDLLAQAKQAILIYQRHWSNALLRCCWRKSAANGEKKIKRLLMNIIAEWKLQEFSVII